MKFLVTLALSLSFFGFVGCVSEDGGEPAGAEIIKNSPDSAAKSPEVTVKQSSAAVSVSEEKMETTDIAGLSYADQQKRIDAKREELTEMHEKIGFLQQRLGFLQQSGKSDEFQKSIAEYMGLESAFEKEYAAYSGMVDTLGKAMAVDYEKGILSEQEKVQYASTLGEKQDFHAQISVLEKLGNSEALSFKDKMSLSYAYEQTNQLSKAVEILSALEKSEQTEEKAKPQLGLMLAQNLFLLEKFDESLEKLKELEPIKELEQAVNSIKESVVDYQTFQKEEQQYRKEDKDLPQVELVTSKGRIVIELFEDDAPNAVANFISLVEKKFYDGLRFHRVIPKFMAQGGDPHSKDPESDLVGRGYPGYRIKTDLSRRKHFRGVISYANTGLDTDGSQFFLTVVPTFWLNGKHAVFGRIVNGMDVVDNIVEGDLVTVAKVLRKRDHAYEVQKISEAEQKAPEKTEEKEEVEETQAEPVESGSPETATTTATMTVTE
jgi:cyclophilin family peptidyl-prolyl cis-trans isomerase